MADETRDGTRDESCATGGDAARPGVVAVFSGARATAIALPIGARALTIGRTIAALGDDRLSRRHVEISYDGAWTIRDLDSRNGTFVDGEAVRGGITKTEVRTIRAGDTILVPTRDARETCRAEGDVVIGGALAASLARVDDAERASDTLVLNGESGTGKELAARRFHANGPHAKGPFVAVNCAAIPEGVAERLLFGTKRGAYSGADGDARGHVQTADGGVLFLDEVAELALDVQAKLLRFLESREALPLGATHAQRVDVRVCVATHRDLRAAVAAGTFRADLYHRLAPPVVELPALRDRPDEIAWHVARAIASVSPALAAHPKLVEACLLREWPGNVREIAKEARQAAWRALDEGADRVRAEHLDASAGRAFESGDDARDDAKNESGERPAVRRSYTRWSTSLTRDDVERALAANAGRVADAARSLGMQRTQLYREMARWSIRPARSA